MAARQGTKGTGTGSEQSEAGPGGMRRACGARRTASRCCYQLLVQGCSRSTNSLTRHQPAPSFSQPNPPARQECTQPGTPLPPTCMQRLLGDFTQLARLWRHLAHVEHAGGVAVVALLRIGRAFYDGFSKALDRMPREGGKGRTQSQGQQKPACGRRGVTPPTICPLTWRNTHRRALEHINQHSCTAHNAASH